MSDFKNNVIPVDFINKDRADFSGSNEVSPALIQAGETQRDRHLKILWGMFGTNEYKDLMKVRIAPSLQKRANLEMRQREIGGLIRYIQGIDPKSWSTFTRVDLLQAAFKILREKLVD